MFFKYTYVVVSSSVGWMMYLVGPATILDIASQFHLNLKTTESEKPAKNMNNIPS